MLSGKMNSIVKNLNLSLFNVQSKEINTMAYVKLVAQKKGAEHFIRRDWIFLLALRGFFIYECCVCNYETLNGQQGSNGGFYINPWWMLKVSSYLGREEWYSFKFVILQYSDLINRYSIDILVEKMVNTTICQF